MVLVSDLPRWLCHLIVGLFLVRSWGDVLISAAARENIIGWYSTGPKLRPADLDINELMCKYCTDPVLLICQVQVCLCLRAPVCCPPRWGWGIPRAVLWQNAMKGQPTSQYSNPKCGMQSHLITGGR